MERRDFWGRSHPPCLMLSHGVFSSSKVQAVTNADQSLNSSPGAVIVIWFSLFTLRQETPQGSQTHQKVSSLPAAFAPGGRRHINSFFACHCDKIPDRSHLRLGGLVVKVCRGESQGGGSTVVGHVAELLMPQPDQQAESCPGIRDFFFLVPKLSSQAYMCCLDPISKVSQGSFPSGGTNIWVFGRHSRFILQEREQYKDLCHSPHIHRKISATWECPSLLKRCL